MKIDWESNSTEILLNPRLSEDEKHLYHTFLPKTEEFKSHVWVATSGSSGRSKFVALSKNALLTSAEAVNKHINSTSSDIWLNMLPDFHVGGIGIWARAYLSGAQVVDLKATQTKWDPILFWNTLEASQATLTALVPTQIHDLISLQLKAPTSLRAVIIGGGGLSQELYKLSSDLRWPLMPSYGLTECASQVATAKGSEPYGYGTILTHIKLKINEEGYICLQSPSLLTAYGFVENTKVVIQDPKENGWFCTEDKGEIVDELLKVHGRSSDFIKIGGESCSLAHLRNVLEEIKRNSNLMIDCAIKGIQDERLGHVIHCFIDGAHRNSLQVNGLMEQFNAKVMPFERIRKVHYVNKIPRSALGKILYNQLQ